MKTDYSELIGKKITYVNDMGFGTPCVVAGAHYSFGVTLKDENDNYVYCSNRETTLSWPQATKAEWKKSFFLEIAAVKSGVFSYNALTKAGARTSSLPGMTCFSSTPCAFRSE